MKPIVMMFVLAAGMVGPAAGTIILVPSVHSTIQAGINAAAPGDTVLVAAGTYTGPLNRNLDFAGRNIVLRSFAGAAVTIINCQDLGRGIRFHNGETAAAVVQGFTIRSGLANGTFGGGILIEGGANPTIRNCRFQMNHANTGGGVFVSSSVTMADCDFEENSADNYGGGAYAETGNLQATRCSFTGNTAGIGAGVSVNFGATAILTDCTFTENDPANLGGGVYASASMAMIQRCSFVQNTGKHGAGAYLLNGTASVDSCTFSRNSANYSGGGLHAEEVENLAVTRSTFVDNSALNFYPGFAFGGGGLYFFGVHQTAGPSISDCMFTENQALETGNGGGMRLMSRDQALVERCTFIGNQSEGDGGGAEGSGQLLDCIFEGNTARGGGGLYGGKEIIDCRFTGNHAQTYGGGCFLGGGDTPGATVIRCEFSENVALAGGGGLHWTTFQSLTIEDSRFSDNSAVMGAGLFLFAARPISVTGSTFEGNQAGDGGGVRVAISATPPPVTFTGCTLVGNGAMVGGGLSLATPVEISNTIIAFGTQGEGVSCAGSGIGVMSCTDIFGNAGGNWTGCIADQLGINGNFSVDPLFCNRAGRDFTLAQASPCSPAHSPAGCGLIGAHPVACATPIGMADAGAPAVTPILRVTPNPMRGAGMIEWSGVGVRETELRLYDVAGRIVARRVEAGTGGDLSWSTLVGTRGVPSGVYFLEVGEGRDVGRRVRLVVIR